MSRSFFVQILLVACVFTALILCLHQVYPAYPPAILVGGNILLALLSIVAYLLVQRKLAGRPQAFVQGVTSGTLLKMAVIIGVVLVYALGFRSRFHKPSLFVFFGMYAVYTMVETVALARLAKRKNG